jgi:precorrin-6A/cobalt-precorrin-6A reductase
VRVLILGGTAQARALADAVHAQGRHQVISSLVGRTSQPVLPGGAVRIGGFGGVAGLTRYLVTESIDVLVDATHPFAGRISANAVEAAAGAGVRLLVLRRRAWSPAAGDRWISVPDVAGAARAVRGLPGGVVFLALGRQEIDVFGGDERHAYLVRSVDAPDGQLPSRCSVVLGRGPYTVDGELALLRDYSVSALVSRNSGGDGAKLVAARALGVPVIMIERPALADGVTTGETVAEILALL